MYLPPDGVVAIVQFINDVQAIAFDRRGNGFYFITNVRGRAAELAWQPLDPAVIGRLLEAQQRGYWNASQEEMNLLRDRYLELEGEIEERIEP